jgi:predicted phosphodiesterase
MKIAVCSDLHLEFGDLVLRNEEGADVLILGGDILVAKDLEMLHDPVMDDGALRAQRIQDGVVYRR